MRPHRQQGVLRAEGNRKSGDQAGLGSSAEKNGYYCNSHLLQANFPPAWPGNVGNQTLSGLGGSPPHTTYKLG